LVDFFLLAIGRDSFEAEIREGEHNLNL